MIRRALVGALAVALLAVSAAILSDVAGPASAAGQHGHHGRQADPRRTRGLFVDPLMPAAQRGGPYAGIGATAQALWLTDYYPISGVRSAAAAYARRAIRAGKTPVVAIYAIPDRDCGGYSRGGEPSPRAYRSWVSRAAAGLKGSSAMVVLEPDALPFLGACAGQGPRLKLLRWAVKRLDKVGAWVYIDAGHDGWQSAATMAERLKKAGVAHARGFSLNVANFRPTADEKTYAQQVLTGLRHLGVRGRHYIIDTSRNGASDVVDGDVCNPVWARVGQPPRLLFQHAYDGGLWIKHPGESDGTCNGGPASGQWSDLLADRLLGHTS